MLTPNENTLLNTLQAEIALIDKWLNQLGLGEPSVIAGFLEAKEAYRKKALELLTKKYNLKKLSDVIKGGNDGNH